MPQEKSGSRDDLKAREYRDDKGQIHHHTHVYMEQHRGKSDGADSDRQAAGGRNAEADDDSSSRRDGSRARHTAQTTTDHDEIRTWAERQGGKPAAVTRTHKDGDVGIIRVMFPDAPNSEHDALTEISWEEFFAEFEDRELALLYERDGMFSKIIGRDTAEKRAEGDHDAAR